MQLTLGVVPKPNESHQTLRLGWAARTAFIKKRASLAPSSPCAELGAGPAPRERGNGKQKTHTTPIKEKHLY